MQALGEVELAAHRRLGDGGDLRGSRPAWLGEQLDDLVLDQGGVDVHDDEAAPAPGQAAGATAMSTPPCEARARSLPQARRRRLPRRRTRRSSRGSGRAAGCGRCWRRGSAIRTPPRRPGGLEGCAHDDHGGAAGAARRVVAATGLEAHPQPHRLARRVSRSTRTFSSRAGARRIESARWPRTTTCSRSSTSAPTGRGSLEQRLGHPGPVGPVEGDEQGPLTGVGVRRRRRVGGSGDTPAGYRAAASRHATRSRIGPRS